MVTTECGTVDLPKHTQRTASASKDIYVCRIQTVLKGMTKGSLNYNLHLTREISQVGIVQGDPFEREKDTGL